MASLFNYIDNTKAGNSVINFEWRLKDKKRTGGHQRTTMT